MSKDKTICLRVSTQQKKKLKELGIKYSDCWELGFNQILESYKDELEKKVQNVYTMYIQLKAKLEDCGKRLESEQSKLDQLWVWYKMRGANLQPDDIERETIQFQMRKHHIMSFTLDQVLDYWRNKKDG